MYDSLKFHAVDLVSEIAKIGRETSARWQGFYGSTSIHSQITWDSEILYVHFKFSLRLFSLAHSDSQ